MSPVLMKIYAATAIASIALVVLGAGLAWMRLMPPVAGFGLFALGCLIGVLVTIAGIGAMLLGKGNPALIGFWFLGAVPAGFLALGLVQGRNYPLINDISTDTENPPQFELAKQLSETSGWDMSFPASNADLIAEHYPHIQPLMLDRPVEDVFGRAGQLAAGQPGWTIIGSREQDGGHAIEGYSETSVFRFRDYFVIDIQPAESGGTIVNMRSKSKDGRGDFGVNAKRIHAFFEQLKG